MKNKKGFTIVELLLIIAIIAVIVVAMASFFNNSFISLTKNRIQAESLEKIRQAFMKVSPKLIEATEIYEATATKISFICDSNFNPAYDPNVIVNGLPRVQNPDDDNDMGNRLIAAPADQWKYGFDLYDDDDNSDGMVDCLFRVYLDPVTHNLMFGASYNLAARAGNVITEGAWADAVLASKVSNLKIEYFGSKDDQSGKNLDVGDDGVPATGDAGENDGLITETEIDMCIPADGGVGNQSGSIDTVAERSTIISVKITAAMDSNSDGHDDASLMMELSPPLMVLKRRP